MDPHITAGSEITEPATACLAVPHSRLRVVVPRMSVVVVNYMHWHETAELVRQLRASRCLRRGAAEVLIVDNNSPPHPVIPRLRRMPGVSVRRWRRNHGFARAVNEGCRLSRGDWILLLNPDVTLSPGFLDRALHLADKLLVQEPKLGIVGFRLHNADGSRQLSAGPFPTFMGTLGRLFLPRARRKYTHTREDQRTPVDWVTGCCLLIRRSCWEQLGGFDSDFFLYYEDVDLCRRAQEAGWTVAFEPDLSAIHHHPLHARSVPPHLRLITRHALLTYARKHWERWQFRLLAGVISLETWMRRLGATWRGDSWTAEVFGQLGQIVTDFLSERNPEANRRLHRVVRRLEESSRAAVAVDHHPQLSARRSAPSLPGQRAAPCPEQH